MSGLSKRLRAEIINDGPNYKTWNASKRDVNSLCLQYEEMEKVLGQIATMKRKTKEQRLAYSCLAFLGTFEGSQP